MSPPTLVGNSSCVRRSRRKPRPLSPPSCRLWRPPRHRDCRPPAAAAPLEDPVSMLDQPELTARVGSILENKYPHQTSEPKRKREPSPNVREELPDQEGFALLDPAPHSPYPVGPRCPMPRPVYRPPSRYLPATPAVPRH